MSEPKKCVCGVTDGRCPETKVFLNKMLAKYEAGLKSVEQMPPVVTILKEVLTKEMVQQKIALWKTFIKSFEEEHQN